MAIGYEHKLLMILKSLSVPLVANCKTSLGLNKRPNKANPMFAIREC
ncbi:hypothetical protein PITCH_A380008 [uncultured Desulfobacterium sp.]|uniref:Uncharacterized protein n=1 Tax=uncultured Desulfobacterium sp. TaxID=201089 RepID=A0A445MZP6_9BACT|nr:hypothetical protein PITCH_A380008 [uncultured Desulfobacterium sp.]